MNRRRSPFFLLLVLVLCLLAGFSGCSLLHLRRAKDAETSTKPAETRIVGKRSNGKGLTVELKAEPDPVRLGETREIKVTFIIRNVGKSSTTLKFPTSQTIEIALRDLATDKVVSQWSTDRTFTQEPRFLVVNADERLEYNEPITTRELKPGRTYNLEASFIGYDPELKATRPSSRSPEAPMLLFSDYHMHPQGHRVQPYDQALLQPWADAARERGLRDIAFTDHDRYHEGVRFEEIDLLRANNPDLKIRAGIELDNDPVTGIAGRRWVEANWDRLDFVLGSVHYLAAEQMFDSIGQEHQFDGRDIDANYSDYFRRVRDMAASGLVDCLAHLDLIKIHRFRSVAPVTALIAETLRFIREKDLAIEVSTAGWRKPVGEQYPAVEIIRQARELGIPFTVASDAHSHAQQAENYERLAEVLEECGVTEVCIYDRHQRQVVSL